MRLLNTKTLVFGDFLDAQVPHYAILSHRWGKQEVSYKEMRNFQKEHVDASNEERYHAAQLSGTGMAKIKNFCQLASGKGLDWAWIDTCCIDKRSSAELSESINAMYGWYRWSKKCYIYLSDFEIPVHEQKPITKQGARTWFTVFWPTMNTKFRASSWFTRGWTLQELLAPERSRIFFFDAKWTSIGSLEDLLDDVIDVTGIPRPVLSRAGMRHHHSCVAQIMSWASQRMTSRGEDIAYCLLGLFGVSMPLLYGEGAANAFYRLQVEIMRRNDDESLFAWTSKRPASGALAPSPACFADSKNIVKGQNRMNRRPYSMTNKGLEFSVPSRHLKDLRHNPTHFVVHLDCFRRIDDSNAGEHAPVALHLVGRLVGDRYITCRKPCNTLEDPGDLKTDRFDKELLPEELRTIYIE